MRRLWFYILWRVSASTLCIGNNLWFATAGKSLRISCTRFATARKSRAWPCRRRVLEQTSCRPYDIGCKKPYRTAKELREPPSSARGFFNLSLMGGDFLSRFHRFLYLYAEFFLIRPQYLLFPFVP